MTSRSSSRHPVFVESAYPHEEFPRILEIQVLAFMRIVWPDLFEAGDRLRVRMWEAPGSWHFVHAVGELLASHVQVLALEFQTGPAIVRVGGVGSVLTYPQFRLEGLASDLMKQAAHLIEDRMDIGMLFCDQELASFYARLGWRPLPAERVLVNDIAPDDLVMTLGQSDRLPQPLRLEWRW
jgi:predicted acetyltransferase